MFTIREDGNIETHLHAIQGIALGFNSKANRVLFGGAAGGSKSHAIRALSLIECYYLEQAQVYLIRSNFGALKSNHIEGPTGYSAMIAPLVKKGICTPVKAVKEGGWQIRFHHNGSVLHMNQLSHKGHLDKFQGAEITSLFVDESTQLEYSWIEFLISRLRINNTVKMPEPFWWRDDNGDVIYRYKSNGDVELYSDGTPMEQTSYPRSMLTCNPVGASLQEHYNKFIENKEPFKIYHNKQTQEYSQFIPAKVTDNPSLPESYMASLRSLPPDLKVALLEGKWMTSFGSFFFEIFREYIHIIKDDELSKEAIKYSYLSYGYDHGTSTPFAVEYHAEINACQLHRIDGNLINVPHGTVIAMDELYGIKDKKWNKGINWGAADISEAIHQKNDSIIRKYNRFGPDTQGCPVPGRADKEIFPEKPDQRSVAAIFKENGVDFIPSSKGPGSIASGLNEWTEMLQAATRGDLSQRHFYFLEGTCEWVQKEMNNSVRDILRPKQFTKESVDHACDATRYQLYQREMDVYQAPY